jgi:hypothetical protein
MKMFIKTATIRSVHESVILTENDAFKALHILNISVFCMHNKTDVLKYAYLNMDVHLTRDE